MTNEKNPFKAENILKAFFVIHRKFNERLPTTVWIFENNAFDNFVLCEKDTKYASDSIPDTNLWKCTCPNQNAARQEQNNVLDQSDNDEVSFVSVKKKDIRKLLKYLLFIKHLRVEIFRFTSSLFEKVMKASPSDLSDVNEILFGEDCESECSEVLGLGPICSLQLVGDIRYSRFYIIIEIIINSIINIFFSSLNIPKQLLYFREPTIGITFWHDRSKRTQLIQFTDNSNLDVTESMIIQYSPVECVVPGNVKWAKQVKDVMERNKVLCNVQQAKNSDIDKLVDDILRSAPSKYKQSFDNHDTAVKSFAFLKSYIKGTEIEEMIKKVEFLDCQEFIRFNSQADSGLHIFDTGDSYNAISLFKLLNRTRTAAGERLLRMWLKQPLTSKQRICERLDIVEFFVENINTRKTLHDSSLRRIPDFESIAIRIRDKRAGLQDLYKIYLGVNEVKSIIKVLANEGNNIIKEYFTSLLAKKIEKMEKYQVKYVYRPKS